MSEDLGAVLEAPELDVNADGAANQDLDTQTAADGDLDAPSADANAAKEEPVDWRKVPAELKEFFKTPAGKAAKDAWFERNAYKEKFPEGIKQVNELTAFLDEHGGRDGLTTALGELQGKAAELDNITAALAIGDLSIVDGLARADGFTKIAPALIGKWRDVDPEAYDSAVFGALAHVIDQGQTQSLYGETPVSIPTLLAEARSALRYAPADQQGAVASAVMTRIEQFLGSFNAKATAPRTNTTVQSNDKFTQREQQLNQREEQAFSNDMKRDVDSFRSPLIAKELDSFFKRRPNDTEAQSLAVATVRSQVIERMSNDATFQKSLNALTARKDKDGAMRLIKSRETAAITEIAPKVGRTIFGNPGAAAAVAARPTGTPSKADAGFSFVDKAPKPELIDRTKTSDAMIMRGKFILKDGRKLTLEG